MRICRLIFALLLCFVSAKAWGEDKLTLRGTVYTIEDGKKQPLDYAVLILQPAGLYASSNERGEYEIGGIDPGRYELSIQMIGYETIDTTLVLKGNLRRDFVLRETSFRLDEVHVVAEASKAGSATASTISRQALDHSLSSSLTDILQFLPGVEFSNPDLTSTQSLTLRTASDSDMNSLGTAIIVDGAPLSNNANMEGINTAITGVSNPISVTGTGTYGTIPNSGIDTRAISTDNIESVEVIRGIPSVQYGDLTSGAVIVNSKAGVEPLTVRVKMDPKVWQFALSKGIRLSEKAGDLNVSGDYAYGNNKTTESYVYYQRLNFKGMWSKRFRDLNTSTSLSLNFSKDTRNDNPDDASTSLATGGTGIGFRLATNGTWNIGKGWFKSLRYDVAHSFTYRESFKEQQLSNATSLFTTNTTSGTTVASEAGMRLYDTDGNEITNFTDGTAYATMTPYTYFCHYDFYSKEIYTFAKLHLNLFKAWGDTSEKILIGADFKSDGNRGAGLVFDEDTPPQSSSTIGASCYRSRPLYDIPFVNQLGIFAENSFSTIFLGREFNLTAGLRFDHVSGLSALAPRVNASYEILPGVLALRGGWGITAKAPTVSYLYPNKAYYDQININTSSASNTADRRVMATTYVFDTTNPDLEIAKNRKMEIGFDLTIARRYRIGVTFYDELMKNGYDYSTDFSSFVWLPNKTYTQSGYDSDGNPVYVLSTDTNSFFYYYTPTNTAYEHQRGIEYELNLGRFDAIRTSFYLNGAWKHTMTTTSGYTFDMNMKNGGYTYSNVTVYDEQMCKYNYEKFISTLRITHNIPKIGFVVTLSTQLNAYSKSWAQYYKDEEPILYISQADGQVYEFTEEMLNDSEYSYMIDSRASTRFIVSKTKTTVVFNLNISKEIRDFLTASFYVNNLFNSRPLDPSETTKGSYTELNNPMYFGFELKFKL